MMAARKSTGLSGVLSALFTTLLAPIVASVAASLIKEDIGAAGTEERQPVPRQVTVRYVPPTMPVTLLPPVSASAPLLSPDNEDGSR
jgi:hypothetical protein